MGNNIEVSVIMSVFNTNESWLRQAIESILNQKHIAFELILIDDKSSDGSLDILLEYERKDNRVQVIKNDINIGLTKSLNKGIEKSIGKYIARMDADDVSVVDRLIYQYNYMENNPDIAVTGGYIYIPNNNGFMTAYNDDEDIQRIQMMFHNAGVPHPTAMIRKSFLNDKDIRYNEEIKKSQDYALWSEIMLKGGKIKLLPKILLEYRIHDGQISSNKGSQMNYAYKVASDNYSRLVQNASDEEKKIFCGMLDEIPKHGKREYIEILKKIVEENDKQCIYPKNKLKKQIYAAWVRLLYLDVRYNKKIRFVFSRMFISAIFKGGLAEYYRTYIYPKKLCKKIRNSYHKNVE